MNAQELQATIISKVADPKSKQADIAKSYALAIKNNTPIDWKVVNATIVERWSRSGLNRIKTMAWQL